MITIDLRRQMSSRRLCKQESPWSPAIQSRLITGKVALS
jgi:hypothetical protein